MPLHSHLLGRTMGQRRPGRKRHTLHQKNKDLEHLLTTKDKALLNIPYKSNDRTYKNPRYRYRRRDHKLDPDHIQSRYSPYPSCHNAHHSHLLGRTMGHCSPESKWHNLHQKSKDLESLLTTKYRILLNISYKSNDRTYKNPRYRYRSLHHKLNPNHNPSHYNCCLDRCLSPPNCSVLNMGC